MNTVVRRLIKYFGTQVAVGAAIGVDQTTVSGWLRGKHSISFENALRIQLATSGVFQATDLCPAISDFASTLNANVRQTSPVGQSTDGAVNPSSSQDVTSSKQ